MIFVAGCAAIACLVALRMDTAARQRRAVDYFRDKNARINYDCSSWLLLGNWPPEWYVDLFDIDFVGDVVSISIYDASSADIEAIVQLRSVRTVFVDGNGFTDDDLRHLKNLRQIEALYIIRAAAIHDAGLKHLQLVPTIRELHLSGTMVTREGIQAFQRARPDCEVHY